MSTVGTGRVAGLASPPDGGALPSPDALSCGDRPLPDEADRRPAVGDLVHYRPIGVHPKADPHKCQAAIVTDVPAPAGRHAHGGLTLTVFTPLAAPLPTWDIPYSANVELGTWHWPKDCR